MTARPNRTREAGMVLVAVLLILVIVAGSSASFVWFMDQQQTRAGRRLRDAGALAAAEAGVHRALAFLESTAPDRRTPGRAWRPSAYAEEVMMGPLRGRFTFSITEGVGGALVVASTGEVGGVARRIRARVHLASPALLAGIYGAGFLRLERPPAATFVLPYGAGLGDRPWIHLASGRGIWFATTDVSVNNPGLAVQIPPGPADGPEGTGAGTRPARPGPVRLLLSRDAELTLGSDTLRVDVQQLRMMGVYIEGVTYRADALPVPPDVDDVHYRDLAARNTANAGVNRTAGRYLGDHELEFKPDSLYTERQFEQLQAFIKTGERPIRLQGIVFVDGGVSLLEGEQIEITDGALVAASTVYLSHDASLSVVHTANTRTLPGIIVLGDGALQVREGARLRVHGLIYVNRSFDIDTGGWVDVVGSVISNDPGVSFRNTAATVSVRYDPAVMGTPGLRVPDDAPVAAWVAGWEELP